MTRTEAEGKTAWEPMRLAYVGHVGDVLQGGGGKLSPCNGDPGDARMPPGQAKFYPNTHPEVNNPKHHPPPCG